MKRIYGLCLGLALAMGSVVLAGAGARADEFTPAQKAELGAFIKDYLVKNPDVLRAAIDALDKHDKEVAEAQRKKAVGDQSGALFSSKNQATSAIPRAPRRWSNSSTTTAITAKAPCPTSRG